MGKRPPRDPSTEEVLLQIQAKRRRTRTLQIVGAALGAAVVLALLVSAAVVSLTGGDGEVVAIGTESTTTLLTPTPTADPRTVTTPPPPPRPTTTAPPATTATTAAPTTSTSPPTTAAPAAPAAPVAVVTIDPGHQARGNSNQEPIGPGSSTTKAKVSGGTSGTVTGTPEHELTLAVALELQRQLEARNVKVILTRTSADVDISNAERTQMANQAGSDLYIRIHADGAGSSSTRGIHVLYPAGGSSWTDDIAAESKRAAEIAQRHLIARTGARDLGTDPRSDITGFNWSDVPVILPEIGFMTNPDEDRLLATAEYRQKIAQALADATIEFVQ